ncbi:hypothetical protein [uncultured Bacteroides sp.]|uniref:hypothetical protein n=1 Tax=uncultured Bacteroides sp. TaxID=162156 RepID=UPI0025EBE47A|nr:hypothetical protein [uncultured Bacteroides sp.]
MKTLKNNFDSIRENKENYLSPSCKVYDLEIEGMVCGSPITDSDTTGETDEIEYGGGFPETSFWNSKN